MDQRDECRCGKPALDLTRVITTAEWVVGAVLIARRLSTRPAAAKASVAMGPGGWVSLRGGTMAVRPARRLWRRRAASAAAGSSHRSPTVVPAGRPWWARALSAVPLPTQHD